jgi:hypothetical protein
MSLQHCGASDNDGKLAYGTLTPPWIIGAIATRCAYSECVDIDAQMAMNVRNGSMQTIGVLTKYTGLTIRPLKPASG